MSIDISVGPPVLTINHSSTFMVTDLSGAIAADSEQGVFASDTRFVSYYGIFANGEPWIRLASAVTASHSARITLTNETFATEEGKIPQGTLALIISRAVSEGIHEDLDVTNYGLVAVRFNLEIALRSDFADLFEVKSHEFVRRGHIVTAWTEKAGELRTSYSNRDFRRQFVYRVARTASRPAYANGRISFAIELGPGATWHACGEYVLTQGGRTRAPARDCHDEFASPEFDQLQREWLTQATALTSTNEDVYRLFRQSVILAAHYQQSRCGQHRERPRGVHAG